jgi:hypothetical protein
MFTFDQKVRETEKNTQKDVLFLWRRIGDSVEAKPLLLKSRDPVQRKTPDKRGCSFARRIGDLNP